MSNVDRLLGTDRSSAHDLEHLWVLAGIAIVLHGVFDPIVTYYIVEVTKRGVEGNALWLWAMGHGVPILIGLNVVFIVLLLVLIRGSISMFLRIDRNFQPVCYRGFQAFLFGLILWGAILNLHNIVVYFMS